jgi:hypothetical protein
MEFGTESSPGKEIRETPALVKDKNGSLRLEMSREIDHLLWHYVINYEVPYQISSTGHANVPYPWT